MASSRLGLPARVVGTAVLLAVVSVSACTGTNAPRGAPSAVVDSPAATVSGTAGPVPPRYRADDLDLCRRVNLDPLAELKVTVQRRDPTPPPSGPGAACLFEMRTAGGQPASLRVAVETPATAAEAAAVYRATGRVTVMRPEGPVEGIGEQAEAYSRESEPGFKYAEYLIQARTGNLVVEVWLAVGGTAFTPKARLATAARAVLVATMAQVPRA